MDYFPKDGVVKRIATRYNKRMAQYPSEKWFQETDSSSMKPKHAFEAQFPIGTKVNNPLYGPAVIDKLFPQARQIGIKLADDRKIRVDIGDVDGYMS